MMVEEMQKLLSNYWQWLRDKTVLREMNDSWLEVTTPHLDRHNDYLQFYVHKREDGYLLTDDGYIINDLISSGCSIDRPRRRELLEVTLAGFGVHMGDNQQLTITATSENFPMRKHNLVQAMLSVNDLFYTASPHVASLFYEDVAAWLEDSDVRFTPRIKLSGKSGYDHMFDFVIPRSRQQPERIVQAINNPKKDSAEGLVFKWMDTRETRSSESHLYALLNDTTSKVPESVTHALDAYDLKAVPWSKREEIEMKLAA